VMAEEVKQLVNEETLIANTQNVALLLLLLKIGNDKLPCRYRDRIDQPRPRPPTP
jgi:hypothetical protein